MKFRLLCFTLVLSHLLLVAETDTDTTSSQPASAAVPDAFAAAQLVPAVVPQAPAEKLTVEFDDVAVDLGNELEPGAAQQSPSLLQWTGADASKLYTLCMTDPDAPSRSDPRAREWLHWLRVNTPGTELEGGQTLTDYARPTPPAGTGVHRYVLLLFEQRARIEQSSGPDTRARFNTTRFAEDHDLGDPVAGNFFLAEHA